MNLFPVHITINGQTIRVSNFMSLNHPDDHIRELAFFLKEWYNDKDYINAQTSGSTGNPKIIRLNKRFVCRSAFRTIHFFNLKPGDRVLHCLPVKYIAGKLMAVRALTGNLDLYPVAPSTDFSFLQTQEFHFAAMIPYQVQKILDSEQAPGDYLQKIGQLLIGGSFLPHPLERKLQGINTACYLSYAMTETATHIALRRVNGNEADEYYRCLEDIKVARSGEGCLQIYMPGLAEQPLNTNDLAELTDEQTFKILGRADNVIISGGIKFSPELLEKKLEPHISNPFLITSLPHESLGQQLILVVEGFENDSETTIYMGICHKYLDKYEIPRKIVFTPKILLTPTGKPIRKDIFSPE